MSDQAGVRYSIGELAAQAEVSRRAVRYYIQRGLLPSPHGAGRGSYYDEAHLTRLLELKEAQRAGASLDELSCDAEVLSPAQALAHTLTQAQLERWLRVPCAEGVELNVRSGALSLAQLATLTHLIKEALSSEALNAQPSPQNPSQDPSQKRDTRSDS